MVFVLQILPHDDINVAQKHCGAHGHQGDNWITLEDRSKVSWFNHPKRKEAQLSENQLGVQG